VILFPAIDLREGRCVRLSQGDFGRETSYDDDPLAVARSFAAAGAQWLHVVDLDAARGEGDNRDVIEALAAVIPIPLQVGGGVRDASLLERGVARVVVGSMAVEDPAAVRRLAASYPGRVAVGLDHRGGEIRVRGWLSGSSLGVEAALAAVDCPELGAVVVTEIGRDGMMTGPDLGGLSSVLALTATPVIASGGVSGVVDLRALAAVAVPAPGGGDAGPPAGPGTRRLAGVIVGRALYEGRLDLAAGLDVLAASPR
jgi:phosphoribosylformimino-5-aminoimidazole carboxamide ribotide isomerase